MKQPDYNVSTPVTTEPKEGLEAKTYWTRLGSGFVNQDESISIRLNGNPINGRLVLFPNEQESLA